MAIHQKADGVPDVQLLKDGRWVQSIRHRMPDGCMVVLRSDITHFKERERAAELLAQHDLLTGLPNRRLTADRLKGCLRITDVVIRYGGDEFVVIAEFPGLSIDVSTVVAKITDAISRPIAPVWTQAPATPPVRIGCSIGISHYPYDGDDPEALVRLADGAMYLAKERKAGRTVASADHPRCTSCFLTASRRNCDPLCMWCQAPVAHCVHVVPGTR